MEVETLNAMINELSKRVSKEKDKGLQTLPEVEEWISLAEETETKASNLLDESISECYNLSTYDDCFTKNPHYSERVCMTLKEVEALRSKGVFKVSVERAPSSHFKKMLPLQPIVSREMLLDKAWQCLTENECGTLGLYGMAGVGKTTLLTRIMNKFIEVGHRFLISVVVKSEDVEDGVHQEGVDFEEIGVPLPSKENGCKIVFTTRYREACVSKWVDAEVEVKCLSLEEAWEFFQEVVGETTLKSHPDIPQLARIVARKCGGLPILLNIFGKTMSRKRTVREWYHAIHGLVSSTTEVPVLKFAYDSLPGENIRLCFLSCALFPENCLISKLGLVDYWIGEGMINDEDREIAEINGYEMIGDLVVLGLLMENESGYGVKMHDMVLEMALWIASHCGRPQETIVVKCGKPIHQLPMVNDWSMVRRMSVTSTQIETISDAPHCSELTTLFLQENVNLKRISGDFFRWMKSLVVLNLSFNRELAELPEEVSSLVSLRFLNLSRTGIKVLPLALKKLIKLIHLDLEFTYRLKGIDVIASLLDLEVLRLFKSAVPLNMGLLEDINLLKSLGELSFTVEEVTVWQRLQSTSHRLASCIRRLCLQNITITEGELLSMKSSLHQLDIYQCNIQRETAYSDNIVKIPQFWYIRRVTLNSCKYLNDLAWLLVAPSLGELVLIDCPQMKEVISKEKATAQLGQTSQQPFQSLKVLSLSNLPELESIYWTPLPFPFLEILHIMRCPKLRRLPLNFESAKGNQLDVDFDEESMQGVEWEDEATKERFTHLSNIRFWGFLVKTSKTCFRLLPEMVMIALFWGCLVKTKDFENFRLLP
ncbi:unnamed protein product [Microthlaspi erraticum]|uniref:NB-ARC domain-containing protein n=1 Tax=Microthlaspi erraticum TaxID=1685480 RepID=A0A6D2INC7_9BRAS|nr:unnamed protein product [Microthlaspi erraticum]